MFCFPQAMYRKKILDVNVTAFIFLSKYISQCIKENVQAYFFMFKLHPKQQTECSVGLSLSGTVFLCLR